VPARGAADAGFMLHDDERRASDPDAERLLGWRVSATRASADAGRGWECGLVIYLPPCVDPACRLSL
jgi:hypothetical protein